MKFKFKILFIVLLITLIVHIDTFAQCPMCRMAAESNLENGGSEGAGLNTGILYMLAMPYLLVAFIGYIWYRNRKLDNSEV
jgi:amino acid transporter